MNAVESDILPPPPTITSFSEYVRPFSRLSFSAMALHSAGRPRAGVYFV